MFYSLAALVRKILFLPLENKIHIFMPPCNILYVLGLQAVFLFGLPRRPPQEPLRILLIAYVPDQCSISAVSIQAYQLIGDEICGGPS